MSDFFQTCKPCNLHGISAREQLHPVYFRNQVYFLLFLFPASDFFLVCNPHNLDVISAREHLHLVYFRYQVHFQLFLFAVSNFLLACNPCNLHSVSTNEHQHPVYFRNQVTFLLFLFLVPDFCYCIDMTMRPSCQYPTHAARMFTLAISHGRKTMYHLKCLIVVANDASRKHWYQQWSLTIKIKITFSEIYAFAIHLHGPSLLVSPLHGIQGPHRADERMFLQVSQHGCVPV